MRKWRVWIPAQEWEIEAEDQGYAEREAEGQFSFMNEVRSDEI